jgi:hypothetical protein
VPIFKRKPPPPPPDAGPPPEEVTAEDFSVRITYAAKSSDGVRMAAGPNALAALPTIVAGMTGSDVEVVEPRGVEFADAAPDIERPSEALQWVSAHAGLSAISRHAVFILETTGAIDLEFDTLACGLLDGTLDTSGYPMFDAIVGGVAAHWDEATGDLVVRGVVGWGGRGVRGDRDRAASRLLGGIYTSILANQNVTAPTVDDQAVPAAGRGGVICPSCGFSSTTERAYYCPKCGMRLVRG